MIYSEGVNIGPGHCFTVEKEMMEQQQTTWDATTIDACIDKRLCEGFNRYTRSKTVLSVISAGDKQMKSEHGWNCLAPMCQAHENSEKLRFRLR